MPLTRYEVRNEYSLANPDLYRAAAKDDPEGLLEGVAMAGLVGIVRQLGDLAEFAAEVFHDLHKEVLATAARGHDLFVRIQQLEAELPFVEKLMLAESNYVNFAYNPGLEWHANIQNDQNHFTQGDLPRFIRNAYEDCRGPPRLFLLDKFDVAGAGACLKRYSDPSFFRMEWASSELMKAEKEQQDKRARRIKKKGRRQREMREAFLVGQTQPRIRPAPLEVENAATSSNNVTVLNSQRSTNVNGVHAVPQGHEKGPESSKWLKLECDVPNQKPSLDPSLLLAEASTISSTLRGDQHLKPNETPVDTKSLSAELDSGKAEFVAETQKKFPLTHVKVPEDVTDFTSETDNYMDALTTIDSEAEMDLDIKVNYQASKGLISNHVNGNNAAFTKQLFSGHMLNQQETELVTENIIPGAQKIPEEGHTSEVAEPAHSSGSDASFVEEVKSLMTNGDLSSRKSIASTPDSCSLPSTPALDKSTINFEEILESKRVHEISETPEILPASDHDIHQPETLSTDLYRLPESVASLNIGFQNVFPKNIGAVFSNLEDKTTMEPIRELSRPHLDKTSFGDSHSDTSEGVKESSPHSSPRSSIQPMKWPMECLSHPNIALDSDDELDGMQVSSPSSSSSNSALSSPRPSNLATMIFDNKPRSPFSPLISSPESVGLVPNDSPGSSMEPGAISPPLSGPVHFASGINVSSEQAGYNFLHDIKSSFPDLPVGHTAAEDQDGVLAEGLEHDPPPPPLPPLEWRMTRRLGGLMSGSNKVWNSPSSFPAPRKPPWRIGGSPDAAHLPPLPPRVQLQHDEVPHAQKPLPTLQDVSQVLCRPHDVSEQCESKETYGSKTGPVSFEASGRGSIEEFTVVPDTVNEAVQPHIPITLYMSISHEVPSNQVPETSSLTDHLRPGSISSMQVESRHIVTSSSKGSPVDGKMEQDSTCSLIIEDSIQERSSNAIFKTTETNAHVSPPHEIHRHNDYFKSPLTEKQIPAPPRSEQLPRDLRPLLSSSVKPDRMLRSSIAPKVERKDSLVAAIASHDKSMLRKVPELSQSSKTTRPNDRENLLEQIRTGSFSLRRTNTEKQHTPVPVTNINVAAILEKANAIRQAFVGSDDDDEDDTWSDD